MDLLRSEGFALAMADPYRKVQRGEKLRISARAYNGLLDLLREGDAGGSGKAEGKTRQTGIVPVKNASDANLGRFAVLGIDGPLFTPDENSDFFQRAAALRGIKPTQALHAGKFFVLAEPIAAGGVGRAYVAGVFPALVNVTDAGHGFADVADNSSDYLASASAGAAQVLWKESGTGVKLALVRIGGAGGGESVGQRMGQVHIMVSDSSGGWEFPFAVEIS